MNEPSAIGSSDSSRDHVFSSQQVTRFADLFSQFMTTMQAHTDAHGTHELVDMMDAHLGGPAKRMEPVGAAYPGWRWADVDVALDTLLPGELVGVTGAHSESLGDLIEDTFGTYRPGAVQRSAFPSGHGSVRYAAMNALRLARVAGGPVVAYAHGDDMACMRIEVLTADPALSRRILAQLDAAIVTDSCLRGQILSFTMPDIDSPDGQPRLVFHERPALTEEDVILPAGRLERIRGTVLGMSEDAAHLRAAGQHLSRGVLLYGPPGTGKTHTVRYLLSQAPGTTAFILQGSSLGLIRQAAETARQLQPAIIVLEDADLVAADRDFAEGERPVLFEVLDVMDGLDDDADIAFVLTTNRVDVLEEALALRPGRIDLAVPIPLPSAALRARLFARSSRELPVTAAGCEAAAEASAGTTGSFPKEAVRRAVLDALADGEPVDDARLVASVVALRMEGEELRAAMAEDADDEWDDERFDSDEEFALDADEDGDGLDASAARRTASSVTRRGGAVGGMSAAGGLLSQRESGDTDDEGEWSADGDDGLGDGGQRGDDQLDDVLLDDGLSGEDLLDLDLEDD